MDEAAEAEALFNEARELFRSQRAEEAEAVARLSLRRFPQFRAVQEWLADALLMQGRYREGFREYETRQSRRAMLARRLNIPEWDGPIAGRSIMLWGEQGLGDEIQTARFVPLLRQLGARQIVVGCHAANLSLFKALGADVVVDRHAAQVRVPRHDCWAKMWSLPYRLGLDLSDISGTPYLSASSRGAGGIGLVESGNPANPRDAARSLPAGSLQRAVARGRLLNPEGDTLHSLEQLAGLDLLITVDTSWAHMAGALGVPCWVLLPARDLDWRWMRERGDSPWYSSVRLFRQQTAGDWSSVLHDVSEALRYQIEKPAGGSYVVIG